MENFNLLEMTKNQKWTGEVHINDFGDFFLEFESGLDKNGEKVFLWEMFSQGKQSVENGELRNALHKAETKIISLKKGR